MTTKVEDKPTHPPFPPPFLLTKLTSQHHFYLSAPLYYFIVRRGRNLSVIICRILIQQCKSDLCDPAFDRVPMINDYEQFNLVCGCAFSLLTHTDIISKPTESAIVAPIILKLLQIQPN